MQKTFNIWLENIIQTEKPNANVIAYYFGIFESEEGYEIYLTGSSEFDNEDSDWACSDDFTPKNKYLKLETESSNWKTILEDVKKLILDFIETPYFKNSFLDKSSAIATGFDDGDLLLIKSKETLQ